MFEHFIATFKSISINDYSRLAVKKHILMYIFPRRFLLSKPVTSIKTLLIYSLGVFNKHAAILNARYE